MWGSRCPVFAEFQKNKGIMAVSTLRSSQAVPHPSTNRALCRLTSEVGRDPVYSTRYGRRRDKYREKDQNIYKKKNTQRRRTADRAHGGLQAVWHRSAPPKFRNSMSPTSPHHLNSGKKLAPTRPLRFALFPRGVASRKC